MSEPMEVRVVLEPRPGGKRQVVVVDPQTGRRMPRGEVCGPDRESIDRAVYQVRGQLQRAGLRVSVIEHSH